MPFLCHSIDIYFKNAVKIAVIDIFVFHMNSTKDSKGHFKLPKPLLIYVISLTDGLQSAGISKHIPS